MFALDTLCDLVCDRAVRRRTGGRRRRWVVLWPAARRAFFIGGVGGIRPDERALKQRTRWAGVFFWFYKGQALHLWSSLGRWRRKVNCEYPCCTQFHSLNELIVYCLISGGSYRCNVECWGDADSAGVEKRGTGRRRTGNVGIKNMAIVEWLN